MDFKLDVASQGDIAIVRVYGDVDIYTAPELDACLKQIISDGITNLAVDLEGCSYFDSEGIKTLVRALKSAGEAARFSVCGAKGSVLRVFEVSGLSSLFRILPSVDHLR
jgi:anti-sigma B factor antagonist